MSGTIKPRIFIGPMEIAGIASGLSEGFSQLGIPASEVLGYPHPFGYSKTTPKGIVKLWQWVGGQLLQSGGKKTPRGLFCFVLHELLAWPVLLVSVFQFNTFIFLFAHTITRTTLELWLLKRLGKKVIFVYAGSEARPPYINGGIFPASVDPDLAFAAKRARKTKKLIKRHERYADFIINSPSTGQFHEIPFINWFAMGIPKTPPDIEEDVQRPEGDHVRIVHSPSHPVLKGSALIEACIERMRKKGHKIDFVRLEGVPNQQVLATLASCDFVIDQLYSDTPMAVFATEAAFLGRPSVVGGYFSRDVAEVLEEGDIPPSCFVSPEGLDAAVERLITDVDYRHKLGAEAKAFVFQKWNSRAVCEQYLRLIRGDVPDNWWFDPQQIRYTSGCGMPEEHAAVVVRLLVERYGLAALQLDDKPALRDAFIAMAEDQG